jgi:phospholipase A2
MALRICSSGTFERFVKRPLTQFVKVAGVPKEVARDAKAQALHPETEWVGALRRSNTLSDAEQAFLHARLSRLTGSRRNMKLEDLDEEVLLEDIPVIALGGSGGGMRANLGFGAVMEAMQADGLWALLAYVAGVSGSCWAIAAFYTWGACDFGRVMDHFETSASHHPLSRTAVQRVADAPGGGVLAACMHVRGAKHEYSVPAVGPDLP